MLKRSAASRETRHESPGSCCRFQSGMLFQLPSCGQERSELYSNPGASMRTAIFQNFSVALLRKLFLVHGTRRTATRNRQSCWAVRFPCKLTYIGTSKYRCWTSNRSIISLFPSFRARASCSDARPRCAGAHQLVQQLPPVCTQGTPCVAEESAPRGRV